MKKETAFFPKTAVAWLWRRHLWGEYKEKGIVGGLLEKKMGLDPPTLKKKNLKLYRMKVFLRGEEKGISRAEKKRSNSSQKEEKKKWIRTLQDEPKLGENGKHNGGKKSPPQRRLRDEEIEIS